MYEELFMTLSLVEEDVVSYIGTNLQGFEGSITQP